MHSSWPQFHRAGSLLSHIWIMLRKITALWIVSFICFQQWIHWSSWWIVWWHKWVINHNLQRSLMQLKAIWIIYDHLLHIHRAQSWSHRAKFNTAVTPSAHNYVTSSSQQVPSMPAYMESSSCPCDVKGVTSDTGNWVSLEGFIYATKIESSHSTAMHFHWGWQLSRLSVART